MKYIIYCILLICCSIESYGLMSITYIKISATNKLTNQSVEVCGNRQPNFKIWNITMDYLNSYEYFVPLNESILCKPHLPKDQPDFSGKVILDGYPTNMPDWNWSCLQDYYEFYNDSIVRIMEAQKYNASAMIFRHDPLYASFYVEEFNSSSIRIPLYYINEHAYTEIGKLYNFQKNRSNEIDIQFIEFYNHPISPSLIIMLAVAMFCIILGGLWSGYTHHKLYLYHMERKRRRAEVAAKPIVAEPTATPSEEQVLTETKPHLKSGFSATVEPPSQPFNWCSLGFFLVLIVVFLLLLYYFNDFLIWFIIVMYTIGSSCAVYACCSFLMDKFCHCATCGIDLTPCADRLERCTNRDWSAFKFFLEYRKIILYLFSVAFSVTWCIFRKHPYAFIAHTILSIFFSIYLIHHMRLPSLRWLTFLLSAMLIYDVFMVYITPFITGNCSVMVEVATGGACSKQGIGPPDPSKEGMPILFFIPRIGDPVIGCFNLTTDLTYPPLMLGLGDVILPGTLIGFNYAFDLGWSVKYNAYFMTGVIGYFFGMIVTFATLILTEMAQPALIFLVPFILIPTHLVALYKKHWTLMWKGQYPWIEDLNPMLDPASRQVSAHNPPLAENEISSNSSHDS